MSAQNVAIVLQVDEGHNKTDSQELSLEEKRERIIKLRKDLKLLEALSPTISTGPRRMSDNWVPRSKVFSYSWWRTPEKLKSATQQVYERKQVSFTSSAIDILFTFFVVCTVTLWWRSMWLIQDIYFLVDGTVDCMPLNCSPANAGFALALGFVCLFLLIELRGTFKDFLNPHPLFLQFLERLYSYFLGFTMVLSWRGAWYLADNYIWGTTQSDYVEQEMTYLQLSAWVSHAVATIFLVCTFFLKSVITGVVTDGGGFQFFTSYEMYMAVQEDKEKLKTDQSRVNIPFDGSVAVAVVPAINSDNDND